MHKNNNHIKLKDYLSYFKNIFSNKEKNLFEKKIMQDVFEEDAFEGLSKLPPDKIENDLNELSILINYKKPGNKTLVMNPIFKYAAMLVFVIGIGSIFYFLTGTLQKQSTLALNKKVPDSVLLNETISENLKKDTLIISENLKKGKTETTPKQKREMPKKIELSLDMEEEDVVDDNDDEIIFSDNDILISNEYELGFTKQDEDANYNDAENGNDEALKSISIKGSGFNNGNTATEFTDMDKILESENKAIVNPGYMAVSSSKMNQSFEKETNTRSKKSLNLKQSAAPTTLRKSKNNKDTRQSTPPVPVIGKDEYKFYISGNIAYKNLPGTDQDLIVKLSFLVEKDGSLSSFKIIKSQGVKFDNEAIRVIKKGPKWLPANEDGTPISKKVTFEVIFTKRISKDVVN